MTYPNLLPWRARLRAKKQRDFFIALAIVSLLSVGLLAWLHADFVSQWRKSKEHQGEITKKIHHLAKPMHELSQLKQQFEQLRDESHHVQQWQKKSRVLIRLLNDVARVMPEGIYLSRLHRTENRLVLTGKAQSQDHVKNFLGDLQRLSWCEKFQIQKMAMDAKQTAFPVDFVVRVTLRII